MLPAWNLTAPLAPSATMAVPPSWVMVDATPPVVDRSTVASLAVERALALPETASAPLAEAYSPAVPPLALTAAWPSRMSPP